LGKSQLRAIGVDDGAFSRRQKRAPLVAAAMVSPGELEGLALGEVTVDGTDATERIAGLLGSWPFLNGARAILLDGVAFGGFNLVDLDELHRALGRPIVTVTRRPPDFEAIRLALRKYFPRDFRRRWRLVRAHRLFRVPTAGRPLLASAVGCRREEAVALVHRTTRRGYWPEPLRVARLVAHAVGTASAPDSADAEAASRKTRRLRAIRA
jgi:endonuclease V-like protein UPF0215 family